jgi:inhibitor of KinA
VKTDKTVDFRTFPLGENALTVEFGNSISLELNEKAVNLANYFAKNPFAGLIETVPAYASLTIFYDVFAVRKNFASNSTAFETVRVFVENALRNLQNKLVLTPRTVEIPVDFSREFALDLALVAEMNRMTEEKVIELFTSKIYRVFMLGFLPGFAYMGEVDEKIAAPRKKSPRTLVPKGSVGIAGRQTGIYPSDSPGGWQIIGKTRFELFTPESKNPCVLQAGDLVKFYAENV